MCLQLEASNDTEENTASDISSKSHDADNNGMPTVRQVSNFVSGSFVIQYLRQWHNLRNQEATSNSSDWYNNNIAAVMFHRIW